MPLLYSVIARGTTVLARYATCAGNFAEVTEQILTKISPGETGRLTYSHASYLFHYVAQDGVVYLCITDDVSLGGQGLAGGALASLLPLCFGVPFFSSF